MQSFQLHCAAIFGFVLASLLTSIEGYPAFQTRIPDGKRVPNPRNHFITWSGVGHQNSAVGRGPRNPFNLDFKANGMDTGKLRPNRGNILAVGQEYLEIPANTPNVAFSGGCSSGCTKQLARPFNVTSSILHMHLLGRSGNITLYRNGTFHRTIHDVPDYNFSTPEIKNFPDPIEVLPGDELRATCVYDSTGKTTPTSFGEGTYDEMCYGIFIYFPASPQLNLCTKWKTIEVCNPYSYIYSKCNITDFLHLVAGVPANCSDGCNSTTCMDTMKMIYSTGCPNQPDAIQFLANFYFPRILKSNDTTFFRCLNETQPVEATTATSTESIPTISTEKTAKSHKGSVRNYGANHKDGRKCDHGDIGKCDHGKAPKDENGKSTKTPHLFERMGLRFWRKHKTLINV